MVFDKIIIPFEFARKYGILSRIEPQTRPLSSCEQMRAGFPYNCPMNQISAIMMESLLAGAAVAPAFLSTGVAARGLFIMPFHPASA